MSGRECYHCKQWVDDDEAHDCWSTTEAALTRELSEELQEAWQRVRETAADFGEQRIYASHHCIMFARKACYFFVRPKRKHLELVMFLGRPITAPQVRRVERPSQRKFAHIVHVTHRDEVEVPITDWMQEAYAVSDELSGRPATATGARPAGTSATAKTSTAKRQAARQGPARKLTRKSTKPAKRKTRTKR
jgi:hypothetical protein